MAEVLGANVTKYDAGASGANWIDTQDIKTEQVVFTDSYEAAAVNIADTIVLAVLPSGAKVQDVEVWHDDLGTSVTLDVGDSTLATRYTTAADVASAAGKFSCTQVDGIGYEIGTNSGDGRIIATVGGGAATGTIKSKVTYTV